MTNITENDFWHTLNEPAPVIKILNNYLKIYTWYNDRKEIHRDNDLPAIIWYSKNGSIYKKFLNQNGKMHHIGVFKIYYWYQNDQLHRENDLPAEIWYCKDGSVFIKVQIQYGELHRDNDLPAEIWYSEDGSIYKKFWYQNGEQHRIDGPAQIWYDENGYIEISQWYLNGKLYTEENYWRKLKEIGYE